MAITKTSAFKSLAQEIRRKYGLSYNSSLLLNEREIGDISKSADAAYQHFAQAYRGEEYRPGGHPDYNYLAEADNIGKTEEGQISAFYMDLKNFTKYCMLLSRSDVYKAKSAAIEAVISVCRIYGGHLHEVPGDGVLVFFGGKNADSTDVALHSLQAACDSMAFLEGDVIPEYENERYPDIYPKMGIDHGVSLWGAYGCNPHYEVKATSFYVDIASKMMGCCDSKEIAIGDSIKAFLDIDEAKYLKNEWTYSRELTVGGQKRSIEYKTWKLDWRKFRREMMRSDEDLSMLGVVGPLPANIISKTKLGDAPLA